MADNERLRRGNTFKKCAFISVRPVVTYVRHLYGSWRCFYCNLILSTAMGLVVKKKKQEIIARDVTNNGCDGYPFGSFLGNFMDFRRFYGPVKWEIYARDSPINGSPVIYSQTMGFRVNIYKYNVRYVWTEHAGHAYWIDLNTNVPFKLLLNNYFNPIKYPQHQIDVAHPPPTISQLMPNYIIIIIIIIESSIRKTHFIISLSPPI